MKILFLLSISYIVICCKQAHANVASLEKNYPGITIEVHPFTVTRKAKKIDYSELNDVVAEYIEKLLKIKQDNDLKLKEGDEQFPDLSGSIGVVINAKNTVSNKYVSIHIGLDEKYQIISNDANQKVKNEFASYIKKWRDKASNVDGNPNP